MAVTIGDQIKAARKENGLTQAQLAEKCGLATITIRQYESSKREPNMGQLLQLASILNVPITYLLAIEDIDGNMLPTYFADPDDFEFIKMLGLDSPAGRQAFSSKQFEGGPLESRIKRAWTQLNDAGKEKVAERIEELVEIPRYRRQGESFPGSEIPKKAD